MITCALFPWAHTLELYALSLILENFLEREGEFFRAVRFRRFERTFCRRKVVFCVPFGGSYRDLTTEGLWQAF